MLEWIRRLASDRKLRLFACAYWRWDAATIYAEPSMASALEYAEAWAQTGVRPDGWPSELRGWHPLLARYAFDAASWTVRGYRRVPLKASYLAAWEDVPPQYQEVLRASS
ncbi:MAG: hypothetical protein L0Z62_38635 [Gemmataceae bacterium]|nr:hypothetical protein [Gemmataceae bacterium]